MTIFQQGSLNTTALTVPDLYVQLVPPQPALNGVPSNILGVIGTATWGPVNSPTVGAGPTDCTLQFGRMQARKFDLGTAVYAANLQGATNFRYVRVTDGTDTAASATITCATSALATAVAAAVNSGITNLRGPSQLVVATASSTTLTLTARYTGSTGNTLQAILGAGSQTNSSKLSIALPGQAPEVFDNLGAASTSSAVTGTFSGGTDGATTITTATLIGQDTIPRKGMYALRGTGCSVGLLADADDTTQWTTQVAFGLAEGIYMYGVSPAGDTISNITSSVPTAGIDSYAEAIGFGDWIYINDPINAVTRLISPQGFLAGKRAALSPEQSILNKPLYGIVGTQKSYLNQQYSAAELAALASARVEVIANPCPGGSYFGARLGINTSSNAAINGDNYTTMTNYISKTLNAGMGLFVGKVQSATVQQQARATIDNFLRNMFQQGMIQAWKVVLDATNNPQTRVSLGYMQADVSVQYLSIIRYFLINLQGGQTVVIVSNAPRGQ